MDKIKNLSFFNNYTFEQQLILIAVVSLFFPFMLGIVPIVLISIYALINKERRIEILKTPYSWCIFSCMIISIITSVAYQNWFGLLTTLLMIAVVIFVFYATSIMDYKFYMKTLDIIIILSIFAAVFGAFQRLYFSYVLLPRGVKLPFDGRVYSVFINPNYNGYIINIVILMILFRLITLRERDRYRKIYYYSGILLNVVALILTNSRSAFISLLLGIICLTFFHKKYKSAIILFFAYCIYLILNELFPDFFPRMESLSLDNSFLERVDIWKAALNGIKKNPITGYGSFGYKYLAEKTTGIPDKIHAHNILIDMVINYGILGTGFLVMFFSKSFLRIKSFLKNPYGKSIFIFMASVFIITIAHGITDTIILGFHTGTLFGFLFSGLGIKFSEVDGR